MKQKTQKPKISKTEKESKFYSLEKGLNLIGKKIFGDDWLFANSLNTGALEDSTKSIKTFRTAELLIKSNFFEVHKTDGQKILSDEQIILTKNGKVSDEFQIPEVQLNYVLKTRRRFCDQEQAKFIRPLIYRAPFKFNVEEVEAKFNKPEAGKIKDQIRIKDFGYWLKQNDLKKEHVYLVMLGINPDYYDFLSHEEKSAVSRNSLFLDDDSVFQLTHINDFMEDFKSIIWHNDWDQLIKDLYIKAPILNPTFAKRCSKFITYIKAKNLLPSHFDQYLDHALYRPNYDEYFKKEKDLDHDDAAFLAMGLDPEYAKKFWEYLDIIDADGQRRFSALGDDEKIFFYKSYHIFLDENLVFIGRKGSIIERSTYEGDLEKFINDLPNKGFLLNEYLAEYLKRKKKFPTYDQDSEFYLLLNFISQMRYWTLENVHALTMDKNPIDGEQIIFPLGRQCSDGFNVYESHDKKTYSVLLKSHKFCDIKMIDQFYPKEGEGYRPQDVLEWLIKHTLVGMPDLLVDLTFKNAKTKKDKGKLAALKKIIKNNKIEAAKTGRPTTVDYPRVWEILIVQQNLVSLPNIFSFLLPKPLVKQLVNLS